MAITNTVTPIRGATGKHLAQQGTLTSDGVDDAENRMAAMVDMVLSTLAVPAGATGAIHGGV